MASQTEILAILAVSLCLIAPLTRATEVDYCDKSNNYAVKVTRVDINPDPVVSGQPATFSISATTDSPIAEGNVKIDVAFFGVHVHTEKHELCEETACPVSAGKFVISHTQVLPGFTPPGSYTLTMKMFDRNDNELTCIKFGFKIRFGSSIAES